jgi:hypothetical protein
VFSQGFFSSAQMLLMEDLSNSMMVLNQPLMVWLEIKHLMD